MSSDVIITKAFHALKIKTGPGGFDRNKIVVAENRLRNAVHLFPQVASNDMQLLEDALQELEKDEVSLFILQKIMSAGIELKAHSAMLQFPLVTQVSDSLLNFCAGVRVLSPVVKDVIAQHLKALKIAIGEGPRAITPQDRETLLQDLEKATQKVLREQN